MKVLILEDFYYRTGQFRDRFKPFGITDITHVTTAHSAIIELSKAKFDIIFLDYHLDNVEFEILAPENTGVKVAEWLKYNPNNLNENATVIIHSGSELGATEIKKYLPNAHIIPCAWKKEVFDQVTKVFDLKKRERNTQGSGS